MENLWNWVINLPLVFTEFLSWLTVDLPYINMSPLALFSVGGLTIIIGFLLVRLVVGG